MKTTETKKKRCRSPSETNLTNNTNALMEMKFFGEFWEYSVGITDQNAIEALVKHGNFGKGILSRSAPKFFQRGNEEFLPIESKPNTEKRIAHRKRPKLALLASNSAEHEEYDDATMKFPSSSETIEPLQLSLVEAFYLSNVLKCLLIRYQNDTISVNEQWTLFQKFQPNFVVQYIVYGHYRKRGWIPKSGLKFGVDFVLYKSDPDHCHADFAIVIHSTRFKQYIQSAEDVDRHWNWMILTNLNRLCESVAKELVIAYIVESEHFTNTNSQFNSSRNDNKMLSVIPIDVLNNFTVKEYSFSRWIPSQTRE